MLAAIRGGGRTPSDPPLDPRLQSNLDNLDGELGTVGNGRISATVAVYREIDFKPCFGNERFAYSTNKDVKPLIVGNEPFTEYCVNSVHSKSVHCCTSVYRGMRSLFQRKTIISFPD